MGAQGIQTEARSNGRRSEHAESPLLLTTCSSIFLSRDCTSCSHPTGMPSERHNAFRARDGTVADKAMTGVPAGRNPEIAR